MRRLCIAALALTATFSPGQALAAGWDGSQELTSASSWPIALAGNEHGRRVVAWAEPSGVHAVVAPRGHRFTRARTIAGPDQKYDAQAAVDERGDIAFVWRYFTGEEPPDEAYLGDPGCCWNVQGAILRRDGRLIHRTDLGIRGQGNLAPLLRADSRGHLALAFVSGNVFARFGTMRDGFGKLHRMTAYSRAAGQIVSVGHGRVIYTTTDYPNPLTIEAWRTIKGGFAHKVLLGFSISPQQIGTADSGRQIGAWDSGVTAARTPPRAIHTSDRRTSGSTTVTGVAGTGAAVIGWQVEPRGGSDMDREARLMATVRRPDSVFSTPLVLDRYVVGQYQELQPLSVDAAANGAAVVGAVIRHGRDSAETRAYLVPRTGGKRTRLLVSRDSGSIAVLRDARGTVAVAATSHGFLARWRR
ncbi:MAG: hypothetical protein QOE38_684 [Thermoleophilaceae bacterium]|nr:hypothetical protein [Thermoleophilaceae bacterium]